jgi:hypothetical protein
MLLLNNFQLLVAACSFIVIADDNSNQNKGATSNSKLSPTTSSPKCKISTVANYYGLMSNPKLQEMLGHEQKEADVEVSPSSICRHVGSIV